MVSVILYQVVTLYEVVTPSCIKWLLNTSSAVAYLTSGLHGREFKCICQASLSPMSNNCHFVDYTLIWGWRGSFVHNVELTCTLQLLFWSVYMANFIGTSMFKSFSNSNKCSFHGQPLSWSSMISPLGSTLQRNFKSLIFFLFFSTVTVSSFSPNKAHSRLRYPLLNPSLSRSH